MDLTDAGGRPVRRAPRWSVTAAVTAVLVLLLSACSTAGSTAAVEPVTLRFMSYNYQTACCTKGIEDLISAFEAANPGIKIAPEPVAVQDVLTKLRTEVAAGATPDVVQLGWSKAAEARANLPLVPVQDIPAPQEWATATAGIEPNIMKAVSTGGKVDIMPFSIGTPMIYYNADLFRKAGLDPNNPPKTVSEIRTAAAAIVKTGAQGVYFGVADTGKSDYMTQSVVNSNGGALVNGSGTVTVDSPQVVGALSTLSDLTRSGLQPSVSVDDALAAFTGGKIGMFVFTCSGATSIQKSTTGKFDLRTAGFPSFGAPAAPTYSGAGLAVLSKDKATQQAAWKFVQFLTSAQGFTILTKEIGYLPLRPSIVSDPAYLGGYFAQNKLLLPAVAQLADVRPYTSFAGKKANQAVLALQNQAVEPVVLRGADPQTTLADTAAKIRSLTGAP